MKTNRNENVYALYKGDKFIDIGTKRSLAKKYGWKMDFITFLASNANRKRRKNNALLTIRIGKEKDNLL